VTALHSHRRRQLLMQLSRLAADGLGILQDRQESKCRLSCKGGDGGDTTSNAKFSKQVNHNQNNYNQSIINKSKTMCSSVTEYVPLVGILLRF